MTESVFPGLLDTRSHVLTSDALGREVALTIWLPPSYESPDATFPVLYVLDAPMTFAFAAQGALITIFDEAMPEVLIVGVGEPLTSAYQWGANRARDYAPRQVPDDPTSGHAAAFFDALRQEIVPLVDGQYRTRPSDRILWGHSLGGAFAIYALLERGGLFQRIIATSPAAYEQGVRYSTQRRGRRLEPVCKRDYSPPSGHRTTTTGRASTGCPTNCGLALTTT